MKTKINNIIKAIEEVTGVNYDILKSRRKVTNISEARQIAMYIIKKETGLSSHDIGRLFNRNHATAIHNVKKVCDYKEIDSTFLDKFNRIYDAYKRYNKQINKPAFNMTDDCIGLFQEIYDTIFVDGNINDMTEIYEYEMKKEELKKKLESILKN